jgi:hypothetical protein
MSLRPRICTLGAILLLAACTKGTGPEPTGSLVLDLPDLARVAAPPSSPESPCPSASSPAAAGDTRLRILVQATPDSAAEVIQEAVLMIPADVETVRTRIDGVPAEEELYVRIILEIEEPENGGFRRVFEGKASNVKVKAEKGTAVKVDRLEAVGRTMTLEVDPQGVHRGTCCPDSNGIEPVVVPVLLSQKLPAGLVELVLDYPPDLLVPERVIPHPDLVQHPDLTWTWEVRDDPLRGPGVYFLLYNWRGEDAIVTGDLPLAEFHFREVGGNLGGLEADLTIHSARVTDVACNPFDVFAYLQPITLPF